MPWAHTDRYGGQGVEFYVNPAYPLSSFRQDWTAPHELSHLILPFVGHGNAWFAEGFASYMQYQVMETMGVLTGAAAMGRYRQHVERAAAHYPYPTQSFVDAAVELQHRHQFPVMYWGGAVYFLQVNQALEGADSSLVEVLRDYVRCCRRDHDSLAHLITELDRLAESRVFAEHYRVFASDPGCPSFRGTPGD